MESTGQKRQGRQEELLPPLNMRTATLDWHQIRYWSALDEQSEEKWDQIPGLMPENPAPPAASTGPEAYAYDDQGEEYDYPEQPRRRFPLWIVLALVLVAGGYFFVTQILPGMSEQPIEATQGVMVKVGSREIGIAATQAGVEAHIAELREAASAANGGVEVVVSPNVSFESITTGKKYIASDDSIAALLNRHLSFVPVATPEPSPSPEPSETPAETPNPDESESPGESPSATPATT